MEYANKHHINLEINEKSSNGNNTSLHLYVSPAEDLSRLYKNRENTVRWLADVVSKSEELIFYVHQKTNNISSVDLYYFSEKSNDIASRSFSFISGFTDKKQLDCFRISMNKISNVMLLLAKERALLDNDTDTLDRANEELNYLLEEEGVC